MATTNHQAIDISAIEDVKVDIHADLVDNMAGLTSEDLTRLHINILTNIENSDRKYVHIGHNAIARAYKPGKIVRAKLGKAVPRTLEVHNVIAGVPDNIQNYREKQPFSVLGISSSGMSSSLIEKNLRLTTLAFGNQLVGGYFHAEYDPDADDALGMYDGALAYIEKDKEKGYISKLAGNYVELTSTTYANPLSPTDAECIAAYDRYISFVRSMNRYLRKEAIVYASVSEEQNIIRGYALKFEGAQTDIINKDVFVSHEARTVTLIGSDIYGSTGTQLIATRPLNFEFGLDLTGSNEPSSAFIKISESPDDPLNAILISMQVAAGTRVLNFNKDSLLVSNGTAPVMDDFDDGVYLVGKSNTIGGTDNEGVASDSEGSKDPGGSGDGNGSEEEG